VPHLLAVEPWLGVYLPKHIEPKQDEDENTLLDYGSLFSLVDELESFGLICSLPTRDEEIQLEYELFTQSSEIASRSASLLTYLQLLLTAQIALQQNLPLWIIK
jgi:hypothetical protein